MIGDDRRQVARSNGRRKRDNGRDKPNQGTQPEKSVCKLLHDSTSTSGVLTHDVIYNSLWAPTTASDTRIEDSATSATGLTLSPKSSFKSALSSSYLSRTPPSQNHSYSADTITNLREEFHKLYTHQLSTLSSLGLHCNRNSSMYNFGSNCEDACISSDDSGTYKDTVVYSAANCQDTDTPFPARQRGFPDLEDSETHPRCQLSDDTPLWGVAGKRR